MMSRIFAAAVFIFMSLCSAYTYAKTIKLASNETKLFTNSSLWTLNATCSIQSDNQSKNKIKIVVLKNKGTINGKNLSSGQATLVTVKNNSTISVSAESGAQINLINVAGDELQAVCST